MLYAPQLPNVYNCGMEKAPTLNHSLIEGLDSVGLPELQFGRSGPTPLDAVFETPVSSVSCTGAPLIPLHIPSNCQLPARCESTPDARCWWPCPKGSSYTWLIINTNLRSVGSLAISHA